MADTMDGIGQPRRKPFWRQLLQGARTRRDEQLPGHAQAHGKIRSGRACGASREYYASRDRACGGAIASSISRAGAAHDPGGKLAFDRRPRDKRSNPTTTRETRLHLDGLTGRFRRRARTGELRPLHPSSDGRSCRRRFDHNRVFLRRLRRRRRRRRATFPVTCPVLAKLVRRPPSSSSSQSVDARRFTARGDVVPAAGHRARAGARWPRSVPRRATRSGSRQFDAQRFVASVVGRFSRFVVRSRLRAAGNARVQLQVGSGRVVRHARGRACRSEKASAPAEHPCVPTAACPSASRAAGRNRKPWARSIPSRKPSRRTTRRRKCGACPRKERARERPHRREQTKHGVSKKKKPHVMKGEGLLL